MQVTSYTAARNHFKDVMDRVCADHDPMIITRQNAEPVVLMSLEDYNSIQETLYLVKSPANARRLMDAMHDVEQGKTQERKLIEE